MVKEEFELFRTAWPRFASCELQTHCIFFFYLSRPQIKPEWCSCCSWWWCIFLLFFFFFPWALFLFSFVVFVINVGRFHSHAHCSFSFLLLFSFPFSVSFSFSLRLPLRLSLSLWLSLSFLIKLSFSSTRPQDQQRKIFGDALQFWANVSGLTFNEVSIARNADIKIRWVWRIR